MIIGCDFHSRAQQLAMIDPETGEFEDHRLEHSNGGARRFYTNLPERALVGVESTGYTLWFAELLSELRHELAVGDAARIRASLTRPQKHDRRDAWHLMELLVEGRFPPIWLPSAEEREVRVLLNHRHSLVEMRTQVRNGLQSLPPRKASARRRQDLPQLLAQLNAWIRELDEQLAQEADRRPEARRLQTHTGVGPLTALATVGVLGPTQQFANGRKVASYLGMIPSEYSSSRRQQFGHLTKQGNRLLLFLADRGGAERLPSRPGVEARL